MAEDWDAVANEVAQAIASVGFPVTLLRKGFAAGPEWEPVFGPDEEYTITAIDDNVRIFDRSTLADQPGTSVASTARVLTVGALGVVPQKGDRVVVKGETHVIAQVLPTSPGGAALLYELYLQS